MDNTKPKRPLTNWTSFCAKYYSENKSKFKTQPGQLSFNIVRADQAWCACLRCKKS